ncbi:MAG: hypothetical protein F4235_04030 [Candidatus Dadabacteria bacterium]|nr:DUF5343 domain-containing protein [Candidatus Dadabacteria bacterium]MXZ48557.1 hypothetical protein [Candidatus Dadabacteria bacterium]MYE61207.1 hypothetical protein [Candidatus Dadabacteria bacterium]
MTGSKKGDNFEFLDDLASDIIVIPPPRPLHPQRSWLSVDIIKRYVGEKPILGVNLYFHHIVFENSQDASFQGVVGKHPVTSAKGTIEFVTSPEVTILEFSARSCILIASTSCIYLRKISMASKLPYMVSVGLIPKILEKVQNAKRPERFTQDFLETKLGHSGGSARPIIPLLKRMGLLGADGVPTVLYDQFRNPETQGFAVAKGIKNAFTELFDRNEYVYELSREKLTGQVIEITGGTKEDSRTRAIVGTFLALKELADFEAEDPQNLVSEQKSEATSLAQPSSDAENVSPITDKDNIELRVGYTINLNLPETKDPEVFNAIFRALRENLLKN